MRTCWNEAKKKMHLCCFCRSFVYCICMCLGVSGSLLLMEPLTAYTSWLTYLYVNHQLIYFWLPSLISKLTADSVDLKANTT